MKLDVLYHPVYNKKSINLLLMDLQINILQHINVDYLEELYL